jgi:hypothetical protein
MFKKSVITKVGMFCGLALITGILTGCPILALSNPGASATNQAGDSLEIVSFDPSLPATTLNPIALGKHLTVHVRYNVTSPDGCRIFVRPLTGGALTPGYAAHPSPLFTGSGEMDGWFFFDASADVDQVRVVMVSSDAAQSTTFLTLILNIQAQWR